MKNKLKFKLTHNDVQKIPPRSIPLDEFTPGQFPPGESPFGEFPPNKIPPAEFPTGELPPSECLPAKSILVGI